MQTKKYKPLDGLVTFAGSLILVFVLCLEAKAAENLPNYYPHILRSALRENVESKLLKKVVFDVLSKAHISKENEPDEIHDRCPTKAAHCYSHQKIDYRDARRMLFGRLHLINNNNEYLIHGVYCSRTYTKADFPARQAPGPDVIPSHQIINTEHTWPQSHFSRSFSKDLQKGDLHILYPVGSAVNTSRSNLPFGEVSAVTQSHCPKARRGYSASSNRVVFEPADEHKGNAARAMFYFSVRYNLSIDQEQEEILRKWDRLDPVDDEERGRNERIYEIQGNRNPFIDYPSLASLIADF